MTPEALDQEVARLRDLDLTGLRARWHSVFGRKAPGHLARHLLVRILAYRIQAAARGDLDRETVRTLDRLAETPGSDEAPHPARGSERRAALTPGTLLVREWNQALHRVMVLDRGFAWNGTTYTSLSKVAFAITGTSWNGPRFFGLRGKAAERPGRAS